MSFLFKIVAIQNLLNTYYMMNMLQWSSIKLGVYYVSQKVNNINRIENIIDKTDGLKINRCTVGINALLDKLIQLKTQITASAWRVDGKISIRKHNQ